MADTASAVKDKCPALGQMTKRRQGQGRVGISAREKCWPSRSNDQGFGKSPPGVHLATCPARSARERRARVTRQSSSSSSGKHLSLQDARQESGAGCSRRVRHLSPDRKEKGLALTAGKTGPSGSQEHDSTDRTRSAGPSRERHESTWHTRARTSPKTSHHHPLHTQERIVPISLKFAAR